MIDFPALDEIAQRTDSRIVMLVVDGLGGLQHPDTGRSELEAARIPNLDELAASASCGLTIPVLPGIAPGSGPGHLALFGYDPMKYLIGRGVMEALGIGVSLKDGDVAARGNFCTLNDAGNIVDRRAGRIPTAESAALCKKLDGIQVEGADLSVYPVQDYRFAVVFRGQGLDEHLSETDPQRTGVPPLEVAPLEEEARPIAQAANRFIASARELLSDQPRANMVLLRGFSKLPHLPSTVQRYKLNPAAIAAYPMYRGLASLVGMKVIATGTTFRDEVRTLKEHYREHDFFYIHYKPADAAGEDGNFEAKVAALEALDAELPALIELNPDVLMVAGDHSTPSVLAAHSWHPVPFLLRASTARADDVTRFTERACLAGALGQFPALSVMGLALAHAGKLAKYGP